MIDLLQLTGHSTESCCKPIRMLSFLNREQCILLMFRELRGQCYDGKLDVLDTGDFDFSLIAYGVVLRVSGRFRRSA